MIVDWGYQDGSGAYFIRIDTDKCNGCGDCVEACPQKAFELGEDPGDPLREDPVALVVDEHRKKLKYTCSPCKTYLTAEGGRTGGKTSPEPSDQEMRSLPCVASCEREAIGHSW